MQFLPPAHPAVAAVRATLETFQDGYSQRDLATLDGFMDLFAPDAALEVLGTSASARAEDEWCVGVDAVRSLIAADWQFWGDLVLDVAEATISVHGSVAWLTTTGTVTQTLSLTQRCAMLTDYLQRQGAPDTASDAEQSLWMVVLGAASALANARAGDLYHWPIRLSAVLVQEAARWQFHQLHFSFPTIHDPDVRRT